jgi:hypothetical protein
MSAALPMPCASAVAFAFASRANAALHPGMADSTRAAARAPRAFRESGVRATLPPQAAPQEGFGGNRRGEPAFRWPTLAAERGVYDGHAAAIIQSCSMMHKVSSPADDRLEDLR